MATNKDFSSSMATNNSTTTKKVAHFATLPERAWSPPRNKQVSGWLTKEEKRAMRAAADGEGPKMPAWDGDEGVPDNYDYNNPNNLLDWTGGFLPAPVEWSGRRHCTRDNWFEVLLDFVKDIPYWTGEDLVGKSSLIISTKLPGFRDHHNAEIVPRQWIVESLENQDLQSFWKSVCQADPQPVDPEDLKMEPYWLRYAANNSPFMKEWDHPLVICEPVSDAADEEGHRLWRLSKTQTTQSAIDTRAHKKNAGQRAQRKRTKQVENDLKVERKNKIAAPPNPNKPRIPIYLRPVNMKNQDDAKQMRSIYNYYVENTCLVTDIKVPEMDIFWDDLKLSERIGLPLIVAILDTDEEKAKRNRPGKAAPERIIGFGLASILDARPNALDWACQLDIFVHPQHLRKGVGKNLMDRMKFLLDPLYHSTDAVPWKAEEPLYRALKGVAVVRASIHYPADDRAHLSWVREWLEKWGFEMQADYDKAGVKMGQWYVVFMLSSVNSTNNLKDAQRWFPAHDRL